MASSLKPLVVATALLSAVAIIDTTQAEKNRDEAPPRLIFTRGNRVDGSFVNDSLLVATVEGGKAACHELYRGLKPFIETLWHEAVDPEHLIVYHRGYDGTAWLGSFDVVERLLTILSTAPGVVAGLHEGRVYFFGDRPSGRNFFSCRVSDGTIGDVMRLPLRSGTPVSMRLSPDGKHVAWLSWDPGPFSEAGVLCLSMAPLTQSLDYKDVSKTTVLAPRIPWPRPVSFSGEGLVKIPQAAFCWLDNRSLAFLEAQVTPEVSAVAPTPSGILAKKVDLKRNTELLGKLDVRSPSFHGAVLSRDHIAGRLAVTATQTEDFVSTDGKEWAREIVYELGAKGRKLQQVDLKDRRVGAFRVIDAGHGRSRVLATRPDGKAVPLLNGILRQYRVSGNGRWIAVIRQSVESVEGMQLSELLIGNAQGQVYNAEKGWIRDIWRWMPVR